MSGTGVYEIQSLAELKPIVGVSPPITSLTSLEPVIPPEPVLISGRRILWRFTQQDDTKNYWLSIAGFAYTGVSEKNVVIASYTPEDDRLWYVDQVGPEQYIIALADDKALGWTVDGLGPDANVVVDTLPPLDAQDAQDDTLPKQFYHLFKLTRLSED